MKITLNELRNIVKQIIKEETENATDNTIDVYGPKLVDRLKQNGFDCKVVTNSTANDKLAEVVKKSDNKLAVVYYNEPFKYISITTNKNNQDEAFNVVNSPFLKSLMPNDFTYSKQGGYFIEIQGS